LTTNKWNEGKEKEFIAWLCSSDVDGLSGVLCGVQSRLTSLNTRTVLLEKHFKWISQLATFNLHWGGCNPITFDLWKATGELSALVWCAKILDMDEYTVSPTELIVRFQPQLLTPCSRQISTLPLQMSLTYVKIDPNRIISKPKLHIFTHLPEDVRWFGPAALYEVEAFEASNQVFRQCSILSNHHAPSHDIAMTMPAWRGSSTSLVALVVG